ncbi:MAG TPA: penicillin acylase family protein, partial [Anaerolineales bacterium]|nr:penicillin acylase family protein [Anaerolineales bacterium]
MIRKILIGMGLVVIVLVTLVVVLSFAATRASFPKESGEVRLAGLEAPVDIHRDSFGIPHIYASTSHDLFFAQGYVHAQDRFYQMDFWRHIGAGRTAEMFGEGSLENDRFLRTLGWAGIVQEELGQIDPEAIAILDAYAEGVNAYLADHQGRNLSLEYVFLGLINPDYSPEPWVPADTLLFAKVMAWNLGGDLSAIDRALLLKTLTPAEVEELVPGYPEDHPVIVEGQSATAGNGEPDRDAALASHFTPAYG